MGVGAFAAISVLLGTGADAFYGYQLDAGVGHHGEHKVMSTGMQVHATLSAIPNI